MGDLACPLFLSGEKERGFSGKPEVLWTPTPCPFPWVWNRTEPFWKRNQLVNGRYHKPSASHFTRLYPNFALGIFSSFMCVGKSSFKSHTRVWFWKVWPLPRFQDRVSLAGWQGQGMVSTVCHLGGEVHPAIALLPSSPTLPLLAVQNYRHGCPCYLYNRHILNPHSRNKYLTSLHAGPYQKLGDSLGDSLWQLKPHPR